MCETSCNCLKNNVLKQYYELKEEKLKNLQDSIEYLGEYIKIASETVKKNSNEPNPLSIMIKHDNNYDIRWALLSFNNVTREFLRLKEGSLIDLKDFIDLGICGEMLGQIKDYIYHSDVDLVPYLIYLEEFYEKLKNEFLCGCSSVG